MEELIIKGESLSEVFMVFFVGVRGLVACLPAWLRGWLVGWPVGCLLGCHWIHTPRAMLRRKGTKRRARRCEIQATHKTVPASVHEQTAKLKCSYSHLVSSKRLCNGWIPA